MGGSEEDWKERGERATSGSFVAVFTPTESETQNNQDKISHIFAFFKNLSLKQK